MSAATNSNESYCTFTLASDVTAGGLPSEEEIAKQLESNDPKIKRHALKAAIMAMLGGEAMPRILMQVIRFCINSDDKPLKKTLHALLGSRTKVPRTNLRRVTPRRIGGRIRPPKASSRDDIGVQCAHERSQSSQ
mmetsp:Transcript_26634/g.48983  ORF Transcript_26634/g.48983 Transcript_26634/m.48983 type:complete len:135 (+) Transcript_26634:63-467(+)